MDMGTPIPHPRPLHLRHTRIQTAFDRIRTEILTAERDQTALAGEIIEMREKMFPTHPPVDSNVKYARGGVVDVEFIVQYLILAMPKNIRNSSTTTATSPS